MARLRVIPLNTYLEETKEIQAPSLFVLNRSRPKGQICFSAMGDAGSPTTITVPMTFIPVDLTTQAPRDKIIGTAEFKRMLAAGNLGIVSEADALAYFEKDARAAKEYERIAGADYSLLTDASGQEIDIDDSDPSPSKTKDHLVGQFAQEIVARSTAGDETEDGIINAVLSRIEELNELDLNYISNNVTSSELKELIAEHLTEL